MPDGMIVGAVSPTQLLAHTRRTPDLCMNSGIHVAVACFVEHFQTEHSTSSDARRWHLKSIT